MEILINSHKTERRSQGCEQEPDVWTAQYGAIRWNPPSTDGLWFIYYWWPEPELPLKRTSLLISTSKSGKIPKRLPGSEPGGLKCSGLMPDVPTLLSFTSSAVKQMEQVLALRERKLACVESGDELAENYHRTSYFQLSFQFIWAHFFSFLSWNSV